MGARYMLLPGDERGTHSARIAMKNRARHSFRGKKPARQEKICDACQKMPVSISAQSKQRRSRKLSRLEKKRIRFCSLKYSEENNRCRAIPFCAGQHSYENYTLPTAILKNIINSIIMQTRIQHSDHNIHNIHKNKPTTKSKKNIKTGLKT